jgi:hypothetical protein
MAEAAGVEYRAAIALSRGSVTGLTRSVVHLPPGCGGVRAARERIGGRVGLLRERHTRGDPDHDSGHSDAREKREFHFDRSL